MFDHQYIVVDDFYQDPDQIRELVLAMPTNNAPANYAGVMTTTGYATTDHQEAFEKLTNEKNLQLSTELSGKFRFSMAADQHRQHIHFDPSPGQIWAGVIYLSLPKDYEPIQSTGKSCGTQFWQHKRTGLKAFPWNPEGQRRYGWTDINSMREFLETEGLDESLWTQTLDVPMQYNRLVLFRPWLFHSPGVRFGNRRENCRLIQTFFLALPSNDPVAYV